MHFRTIEISILSFLFVLLNIFACYDFCLIDQKIKKNISLYEDLATKSLENRADTVGDFSISFPYKILYSTDSKIDEIGNDPDVHEYIKKTCTNLGISYIMINEGNDIFLFFPRQSNFFKGELIEEYIEIRAQSNRPWSNIYHETSEIKTLCDVTLTNKSRYVKIISSN
jgi:hypothetical protein